MTPAVQQLIQDFQKDHQIQGWFEQVALSWFIPLAERFKLSPRKGSTANVHWHQWLPRFRKIDIKRLPLSIFIRATPASSCSAFSR